ncbi:MAG: four helix bundle protein [Thermodesulfobacteriota bacterium]
MAQYDHLPIYKAAFDLLVYFEKIVANFSRYHKYTHGSALRDLTRDVIMLVVRANNTPDKLAVLEEIRIKLEELKVAIRICKEVKAFPNFNSFQTSINQVIQIAKQNEGWMRSLSGQRKRPDSLTDASTGLGM